VAYDAECRPSFNVLQNHLSENPPLRLDAFDLLIFEGEDLMHEPLAKRRELLGTKVMPSLPDTIRFSETLDASAAEVVEALRRMGLEGVSLSGGPAGTSQGNVRAHGGSCASTRSASS
jgi:bifunctional non-homologous end joining protein LigD